MLQKDSAYNRLSKLGGSDFEIADGQPDIRGWDVKDSSGKLIGEVDELLFDETTCKVRYIVLDLEGNEFDLETRDVLVPIGMATLHERDDDVILTGVTVNHLRNLPEYDHEQLNSDHEHHIRNVLTGSNTEASGSTSDEFYEHEHFNDDKLYGTRKSKAESVPVNREKNASDPRGIRLRSRGDSGAVD